jgi:hypothetical protein
VQVHEPVGQLRKEHFAPVSHTSVHFPDAQSTAQVAPSAHVSAQPPGAQSSVQFPPAVHDVLQPPPAQSMVQSALPGGHAEHTPFEQVTVHWSTPQLDPLLLPPYHPPLDPPYQPLSVKNPPLSGALLGAAPASASLTTTTSPIEMKQETTHETRTGPASHTYPFADLRRPITSI